MKHLEGNQLTSALEAYIELKNGLTEALESVERIGLMLKVISENLMNEAEDDSA